MDKILEYHYGDHNSEVLTLIDSKHMSKIAEYSEDIQSFVDSLERKAGMTYALVNAMSAGEYYGSNRNGDYFPKKALKDYHKTFESNGHVYKHHVNKDPRKSLGRVAFSHYNPGMNRVELVLELSDEKATDIIEKLNKGHLPAVSMGCFPADTPVIMDDMSKKPISEIEIGDEVLSHTGQLKEVTELHPREYEGEMYIIKPVGKYREPVSATKEHP
ncbi:hypothetical protein H8D85_01640 [bacterium]|nr:hypothetical protein [bacterium]